MLLTTLILVGLLNLAENNAQKVIDYCERKICPYQGPHVACNKTKVEFQRELHRRAEIGGHGSLYKADTRRTQLLQKSGGFRQCEMLLSGCKNAHIVVKQWDWGLAEMAEYNVRSCVFAHDKCRSTEQFPFAGQNIYTAKTTHLHVALETFIKSAIYLWFEEQFDANYEILLSFRKTKPQTGHFTLLVSDRQNRVGCAFLNNKLPGKKTRLVIFTCNYSSSNIRGWPSYKPGKTASQCKKSNKKYPALCEDPIDPNNFTWYKDIF